MQVSSHLVNKLAYYFEKIPSYIKKQLVIFLYSLNTILKKLLIKFQTPNIKKALSNIITIFYKESVKIYIYQLLQTPILKQPNLTW